MRVLHSIRVRGFKSIKDQTLELGPLNVFIGANGAGKSNLIGVFHLLNRVSQQKLQVYVGESGGANALLHFGRKHTEKLCLEVEFRDEPFANMYEVCLRPTDDDRFIFESEDTYYQDRLRYKHNPMRSEHWEGHSEAQISNSTQNVAKYVRTDLNSYRIYHFHDTSPTATVKQTGDINDNRQLAMDAGNLAAFLYMLQERHNDHFRTIEDTVRQIAPFFGGFVLQPSPLNPEKIRLQWHEKDADTVFGPSALSDGTLRFICLATLLLQPTLARIWDGMPSMILVDEPELGLHPAAIQVLAGMLQSAAVDTQLVVSTQSVTLVNQLQPELVWIADRKGGESVFHHLAAADMSEWPDDYGLGELWEKNILGGRP